MKKHFCALFLLTAVMTTVLCACGDSKPSTGGSVDANSSRANTNEMIVGIAQDLGSSLDPYQMTAAGTREILFNVFEGLYKPDSDGNFVPTLAETHSVSEDGLIYTFPLKSGIKYHNGDIMTPQDIVYSFETCAATTVDSSLGVALSNIVSVTAGESEVTITLAAPNSDFIAYAASVYIVPAGYKEQASAPVGTGPFRFVSRSVQDKVVLERFEEYHGTAAKLSRVTCKIYEDSTAMMTALEGGSIDMVAHLTTAQVGALDPARFTVLEGTMNLVQALYLNHAATPFQDVRVRRALCHAVDVDELLSLTADGHGTKLGSSMYPAFGKYFDDSLTGYYATDIEKAKSLLADAGYPDGFDMTITVPSNYTPHVDAAQVLVQQLARAGIRATLKEVEWNTWLSDVYQGKNFTATVVGFDASNLTANAMLQRWTSSSSKNMISFSDKTYDALIAKANEITDDAERTDLFLQAERILTEQAANVYLQDLADMVAISSQLTGYRFYPLYVMDFSTISYVNS